MNIVFVGTGYVGLVSGTCFAEMGGKVCCVDIDEQKIALLKRNEIPIYEPGLAELVERNTKAGRLRFSTGLKDELAGADIIFCAPGTPSMDDGSADLRAVWAIAKELALHMNTYKLIVIKSTVPVGTVRQVKSLIKKTLKERGVDIPFDVASNPEFLKEGDAIADFIRPDRIVVGVESKKAQDLMEQLYKPFTMNGHPILFMDIASAEMTKYAANAMLATRISFMNEVARLCDEVGADIHNVRKGIGSDPRIGSKFLYAGTGYGGSCFPKDVKALIHTGREHHIDMQVLVAVEEVNAQQKLLLVDRLREHFAGNLAEKTIALWGLAFKPQTDDLRDAPALEIIHALLAANAKVRVCDPVAVPGVRAIFGDKLFYAADMYQAAEGADALLLITEWKEFRMPQWEKVKELMKGTLILDGRNIYDGDQLREMGLEYSGIGRK